MVKHTAVTKIEVENSRFDHCIREPKDSFVKETETLESLMQNHFDFLSSDNRFESIYVGFSNTFAIFTRASYHVLTDNRYLLRYRICSCNLYPKRLRFHANVRTSIRTLFLSYRTLFRQRSCKKTLGNQLRIRNKIYLQPINAYRMFLWSLGLRERYLGSGRD